MATIGETFIQFALSHRVLEFGDFKLKSGRTSPYFFNLGAISGGGALSRLGDFYADAITESGLEYDVIFGPAYKGIPLATVAATRLHQRHGVNKAVAYNRKEAKDHGEGGQLVGAPIAGRRVLILDDVMTAGTAVNEAAALIQSAEGTAVGVAVSFDREEKDAEGKPAIGKIKQEHGLRLISIANFHDLLRCADAGQRGGLENYFARYGRRTK